MNAEKLQQIDELLTQIAEDAVALASDVTKLKAKREQIELKLTEVTGCEQPKVQEFFTKIHAYGIFPNGESCKLAERDLQYIDDTKYMTRATPELAEHDAIALHNYARLLAYRAEHWPDFITAIYAEICHVFYDGLGNYAVRKFPRDNFNSYGDSILFPPQAEKQLQQALDNGLLVPYKQTS